MKPQNFQPYSRADYYDELVRLIDAAQAGEVVMLATMAFVPSQTDAARVLRALREAGKRGAQASLIVDAYPLLISRGKWLGPLWFHPVVPANVGARWRPVLAALEELEACGVKVAIINVPERRFSNPYAGRSHIKFAVVGERAFIGGCNLNAGSDIDLMVAVVEPEAVRQIRELGDNMAAQRSARAAVGGKDVVTPLGSGAQLIIDAGVRGRSLIFEKALRLIDGARDHIFITCQFFPHDVTAQHLLAATRRGVHVDIRYNHPRAHLWPNSLLHYGVVQKARRGLPESFFEHELPRSQPFLHAKLIATEQGAIVGSHNYVTAGVRLGTAEIALLSHDPTFARAAQATIMGQLN